MARVLLVDDEPALRLALRQYLEFAGHAVLEAGDGDEALEVISATTPDVVVSDVLMPRRDGISLCRELRDDPRHAGLPFLFITARNTQSELFEEMRRLGDGCISKPFEPEDLLSAIERAVLES